MGGAAPDRLTSAVAAYLAWPGLLFLAGWAVPAVAALGIAAALLALAFAPGWRGGWPLSTRVTGLCLALGLLWAGGTGAHHLVYATADWQLRDAVLRDLATGPWPILYRIGEAAEVGLLRAPIGYFLPAGAVGRIAGPHAAQAALWIWGALGFGLVLLLLATIARRVAPDRPGRAFAVLGGVFAGFGGLDILPNLWLDGRAGAGLLASWGRGGEWWARLFQYPGHVTSLLWAPNHALPAWLAALLLLRHAAAPGFARGVALPLGAGAFWSPIAAVGAALLTGAALLRHHGLRTALRSPANWLAAAFVAPLCLYLTAGATGVRHEPLLAAWPADRALSMWALFLLIEVLAWAALAAVLVRGWLFGVAVALLCVLPGYIFGPGNEMTSRGGAASLAILAVVVAIALLAPTHHRRQRLARAGLIACTALAFAGSAMEASLLVAKRSWPASPHCNVPQAARESVFRDSTDWSHYFAPWPDARLVPWLATASPRPVPTPMQSQPCWPHGGP